MPAAKTLLEMAGADVAPPSLGDAAIVLIDCQNEYVSGALPLVGVDAALDEVAALLERARDAGAPVIHVVHQGRAGSLFDLDAERGRIAARAAPADGEIVVKKPLPNAFHKTELGETLAATGRKNVVFGGFMTHMCISSTVRAALDLGYRSTLVAGAAATRDLPGRDGDVIPAAAIHAAALAELGDRFAVIVDRAADLSA